MFPVSCAFTWKRVTFIATVSFLVCMCRRALSFPVFGNCRMSSLPWAPQGGFHIAGGCICFLFFFTYTRTSILVAFRDPLHCAAAVCLDNERLLFFVLVGYVRLGNAPCWRVALLPCVPWVYRDYGCWVAGVPASCDALLHGASSIT